MADGGFFGLNSSPKLSSGFFNLAGGAVSDLFASDAASYRAQGAGMEAAGLDRAANFADFNAKMSRISTEIGQSMLERKAILGLGTQTSQLAATGFSLSGSALDIMRDSVSQATLEQAIAEQQGLVAEVGYREQAAGYRQQASAARVAQAAAEDAADANETMGWIKGIGAVASLFL